MLGQASELDGELYLILRPDLFGKTLNLSMMQTFLDIDPVENYASMPADEYRQMVQSTFEGSVILGNTSLCERYMG